MGEDIELLLAMDSEEEEEFDELPQYWKIDTSLTGTGEDARDEFMSLIHQLENLGCIITHD